MAEGTMSFFEPIRLDGFLYLLLLNDDFVRSQEHQWLRYQSKYLGYLRTNTKGKEEVILCANGKEVKCVFSDRMDRILKISWVKPLDFHAYNGILRYGIPIEFDQTVVMVRASAFPEDKGLYTRVEHLRYANTRGYSIGYNDSEFSPSRGAAYAAVLEEQLRARMNIVSENAEDFEGEEPYQPHRELAELLELAEDYSNLEQEIAVRTRQKPENTLRYHHIEAVEYDRLDRTAYAFYFPPQEIEERSFAEGQQVDVYDADAADPYGDPAEIMELVKGEEEYCIKLLFKGQVGIDAFNHDGGRICLSRSTVIYDVQQDAIRKLRQGSSPAKYMDAVFGTKTPGGFCDLPLREVQERMQRDGKTAAQIKAVIDGIRSKDVYLVMGPPGTGKTTVIVEWVKHFVSENKRVLISSQNNKAVDNVLQKFTGDQEKSVDMIRIGSEKKTEAAVKPYLFENKVRDTSRRIAEKTTANIARLRPFLKGWTQVEEHLQTLTAGLRERDRAYQQMMRVSVPTLRAQGEQMAQAHVAYCTAAAEAAERRADVRRRYERIMGYPTEGLAGLWGWLRRMMDKYPMRRVVRALDAASAQEAAACTAYNEARAAYEVQEQRVYADEYAPMSVQHHTCKRLFAKLGAVVQKSPTDLPWTFFAMKFPQEMKTAAVEAYASFVSKEKVRLSSFLTHLEAWRVKNESEQDYALRNLILSSVNLVGATCIGVNSQKRFADLKFDVTIIDEAGQIQIHNALVPMSVSNKLIMLGDHQQIPPSADEELESLCRENDVETELLGKSLFEKMYEDEELPSANKIMLDTQFRMPPEVAAIISRAFYHGDYKSIAAFKANVPSALPALSDARLVVISTSDSQARYEKNLGDAGTSNPLEAQIAARIVRILLRSGHSPENFGVISAYKAQVGEIQDRLRDMLSYAQRKDGIATLDSFQGQERDIIIYSFTRSSRKPADKPRIGFLKELRRLNVAMTRCKKMLILIGDMDFLQTCRYVERDKTGRELLEKSEARFSEFIRALMEGVRTGMPAGECMMYQEFVRRMEVIDHGE